MNKFFSFLLAALFCVTAPLYAAQYDPGATDKEIVIGTTVPQSGPASFFKIIGENEAAYFEKINQQGGINGRKIWFISLDDAYNPAKTLE
jgi:branched-chain amino acid transport system substrate-binding protein